MTTVEVLYFEGCPSHHATLDLVRETLDRLQIEARVTETHIRTDEEAERRKFLGSPSVRVDGEEIEPDADSTESYGRRCRLYQTPDGLRGVPPIELLEAALTGEPRPSQSAGGPRESADCCAPNAPKTVQLLVADWCPQCPAAKTFWEELQDHEDFRLEIIDIESKEGSELVQEQGIRAVPATVIDGVVAFRGTTVPDRESALDLVSASELPG